LPRVVDQPAHPGNRLVADQLPERASPGRRIEAQLLRLPCQRGDERLGHRRFHHDPVGRHANLALVEKRTMVHGARCRLDIGVGQHDRGGLAGQFQKGFLQMSRRHHGDLAANPRRAGEIHPPHRRMRDQGLDHAVRVLWSIADEVEHAVGQARSDQRLGDPLVQLGAKFRGLQHHGIAQGKGRGHGAHRQRHRRVPWRDAENDAGWLADQPVAGTYRAARSLRGADRIGEARGVLQGFAGNLDIEAHPVCRRADLGRADLAKLLGGVAQAVGGAAHQLGALGRRASRPFGKRPRGGIGRGFRARGIQRRGPRDHRPGDQVAPLEGAGVRGGDGRATDDGIGYEQVVLPNGLSLTRGLDRFTQTPRRSPIAPCQTSVG